MLEAILGESGRGCFYTPGRGHFVLKSGRGHVSKTWSRLAFEFGPMPPLFKAYPSRSRLVRNRAAEALWSGGDPLGALGGGYCNHNQLRGAAALQTTRRFTSLCCKGVPFMLTASGITTPDSLRPSVVCATGRLCGFGDFPQASEL